jgi:peptidyl-prolyl cis-trans isomerase D
MLQALRSTAGSWIVKILFVLLIISFGAWGIGDIFRGRVGTEVAEVGDAKISAQELDQAFRREMDRLRQVLGAIDPEQARAFGLLDRTLDQLVERALLDQEGVDAGVRPGDALVLDRIQREPAFQDRATGRFSPDLFRRVLASSGIPEASYLQSVRAEVARETLAGAVTAGASAPAPLVEDVYRRQGERRVAETLFLPDEAVPAPGAPDAEAVAKYHQDRAVRFTAPEYRALAVGLLTVDDLAKEVGVSDEELRAAYAARAAEFRTPERRDVEQVLVQDEAAAQAVAAAARQGGDLAAAASASGAESLPLPGLVREDLLPELAEAVFSGAEGAVVGPVRSPLGWHVFKVAKVQPGTEQSFEQVRDVLRDQLGRERAADRLYEIANQIEDTLAGGASVEEAASRLGLRVVKVPAVDASGQTPEGRPVEGIPGLAQVLEEAFRLGQGEQSRLIETPEGAYAVVQVEGIRPAALRPLDEVRDQVVAAWQAEQRSAAAAKRAEELAQDLRAGKSVDEVAKASGARPGRTEPLPRGGRARGGVPPLVVEQLFEAKPGEVVTGPAEGGQMVARLAEVQVPDPAADAARLDQLRQALTQSIQQDLLAQYVGALRAEHGVEINRPLLDTLYRRAE